MTETEIKAAKYLRPHMSRDSIIVDVGSNKGDWAEIFAGRVKELHLFEPNEVLLHYSMVRFCEFDNVYYHQLGLSDETKMSEFYYFINKNNGLSSIFKNQRWIDEGLPIRSGRIQLTTLDNCSLEYIDFLKIDVEGADYNVLKGADGLLSEGKIKFIQVENSDHLKLSGHTWQDILDLMDSYGYKCYDFDGENFVTPKDYTQENYYFIKSFTQDWNSEFKKNTKGLKFNFALEIGAFEGLTTTYICDNLLNPGGRVIVIDPLPDDPNSLPFGEDNKIFEGQYERFKRNTTGYPIELIRKESKIVAMDNDFLNYRFNFIYIDGDHTENAVYRDGIFALNVCHVGGYILFDDYGWRAETKAGIDRFLRDRERYIQVIVMGYQVMVKKVKDVV